MSEQEQPGADIIPLRASDIHYELSLDQEDPPGLPVPVDPVPAGATALLPVIPEHLSTIGGVKAAAGRHAQLQWHRARYHAVRSPRYAILVIIYATAGVFRVLGRQVRWWWALELHSLLGQSVASGDDRAALRLHKEAKQTRRFRGYVLLGELAAAGAVAGGLVVYGRWQADALAVVAAAVLLARAGRPADKPIVTPAVVTARFRKLSADIVLRAYYAAGLGHPDKPDQQVTFGSPMRRDGEGSRVLVDLPYGRSLKDAMDKKDSIASGLDVTESQVYLHRDPTSARRHTLWVADRDPLAVPVGRTPLLACKQTDIWKPAPLGLDERGQLVKVLLMWHSLLVGALPRMGKTFAARQLALFAALDPYVRLHVFDPTGKPDWRKFALVADSCAFGLTPTREGLPPEILLATLEGLKGEVNDRYARLSELQDRRSDLVPQGKLTRELARDLRMRMQVNLLVIDEAQEYFDLGKISEQIADLLVFLTKVAPAAGMPVILATQRPSGIGTGTVAQRFIALRDMCAVRFSLRTPDWRVSEMVLGAGALGEGLDSSKLLPEYKGVGILRNASDASPTVRTFLAEGPDAERILVAARALRERAGTLSGMALGETPAEQPSIVADVLAVLGDETAVQWETLAQLLAQRFPERHRDATAESVSAQCRAAGVPSVDVKRQGRSAMGCRREHAEAVVREQRP
jgi:hypothetical protein